MKNLRLILILSLMAMVGPFATDSYIPSFEAIGREFSVSQSQLQQTLSVYMASFAMTTLFIGSLSDTFGRKPIIQISFLGFFLASIGCSFAPNFQWLVIFRALQGVSGAAGMVLGQAIVRDSLEGIAAQKLIANIVMIFGIAPAIAPIIGGQLETSFGWRSNFIFMALFGATTLIGSTLFLDETLPSHKRQSFRFHSLLAGYKEGISNINFVFKSLAMALAFGGVAVYIASSSGFIIHILHLKETDFAWFFIPLISGIFLASFVNSRFAHKLSGDNFIKLGFIFLFLGSIVNVIYTQFFPIALPFAVLPITIYSFGMSLAQPSMALMALNLLPQRLGLASSLQNFFRMGIFVFMSAAIAPMVYKSAQGLAIAMLCAAALTFTIWIISTKLKTAE